jgi:Flp pilus assembly protein TadG
MGTGAARYCHRQTRKRSCGNRTGALLSLELLLVLPVLGLVGAGFLEFSLLLMGMQRVQTASSAACRVGPLPAGDAADQQQAMHEAAERALGTTGLAASFEIQSQVGQFAGDPVVVEVRAPMSAAAPDLLKVIGFGLEGRQLTARAQMCKQ